MSMSSIRRPFPTGRPTGNGVRRGYTLVEITIAITLLALFVFVAGRVLVGFVDGSSQQLSRTDVERDRRIAAQVVSTDLGSLQTCDPARLAQPFTTLSDRSVTFYADPAGEGTIEQITYEIAGSAFVRTTSPDLGGCTFAVGTSEVLLDGLRSADGTPPFRAWQGGAPVALPTPTVDCTGRNLADACKLDLLELNVTSFGPGSGPISWHQTYEVDRRWSRL